jgi:hypothetical protein
MFKFHDLVKRHGEILAWHYLAEIERAAGIRPQHSVADPEARLAHACFLQDMKVGLSAFDSEHRKFAA